jgi:undecaprenyl-diphosphatase
MNLAIRGVPRVSFGMPDWIAVIVLGIIEGLTEFLPISSTGHLIVAEKMIGYKDSAELFTVVIQVGAIFAVLWHYRKQLINITLFYCRFSRFNF